MHDLEINFDKILPIAKNISGSALQGWESADLSQSSSVTCDNHILSLLQEDLSIELVLEQAAGRLRAGRPRLGKRVVCKMGEPSHHANKVAEALEQLVLAVRRQLQGRTITICCQLRNQGFIPPPS